MRPQPVVDRQGALDCGFPGAALPVGNDVGKDLVDSVAELRMLNEGLPVFGGCYRDRTVSLHASDDFGKFGRGALVPEYRFIAHDQTSDVGVVSRQIEGGRDLALVSGFILVDPGAKRDR